MKFVINYELDRSYMLRALALFLSTKDDLAPDKDIVNEDFNTHYVALIMGVSVKKYGLDGLDVVITTMSKGRYAIYNEKLADAEKILSLCPDLL